MSALPPKADMCSATHVRFVPIADISPDLTLIFERKQKDRLAAVSPKNSITLTSLSSAALLMLHQDLGPYRNARVKICDIVVDQPEAA